MHRLFKILFCSLLVSFSASIRAQNTTEFINGILLDATTKEPIVFATVRVKGKALGVISNNDGSFQIPKAFQLKGQQLEISSMGYQTTLVSFEDLLNDVNNIIYVSPATFQLAETTVEGKRKKRLTAKQIIRFALERIPENYPAHPFGLIGYYRDYQFKEREYSNLNEALIEVIDQGFQEEDYRRIQFGLFDYATNLNFKIDSFAAKPYDYSNRDKYIPNATFGGTYAPNELVLLFIHDAIRNNAIDAYSFVYVLVEDFIKEHGFSRVKRTSYGAKKVFEIGFRKSITPFQVRGTIYIDENTFAIRKLDYAVYKQQFDNDEPSGYSTLNKKLLYEILVEYQEFQEKMYLNYISFHNQFKLVRPPKFFIKDVLLKSPQREMKVFLNRPAANWPNDFVVQYQGKNLKIENILKIDPMTLVIRFSEKNTKQQELINMLFSKVKDVKKPSLNISIPSLKDSEGNYLGERETEIFDQFREFFTQKVVPDEQDKGVSERFWVKKGFSLGNGIQPQLPKAANKVYWMNTPLKSKN